MRPLAALMDIFFSTDVACANELGDGYRAILPGMVHLRFQMDCNF